MAGRIEEYNSENEICGAVLGKNHVDNVAKMIKAATYELKLDKEYMGTDEYKRVEKYYELK